MSAKRGRAALLRSTGLLLVLSLGLPAPGSAAAGVHRHHHAAAAPDPDAFNPGEDSRAALSRLVAEPGTILKAYAPTTGGGMLPEADDVAGARETLTARSDADLATGAIPSPAVSGGATPADDPAPLAVATSANDPVAFAPVMGDGPVLDAATLQRALEAWVNDGPALTSPHRSAERAAIAAFYAGRGYAPLWIVDGGFDARARSASARLDRAAEDGLDLKAFTVTAPRADDDPSALAVAELSLSEAAVEYGRQASGGRVDPGRVDPLVAAKPDVAGPVRVLSALRDAIDPAEALLAFNPAHKGYRDLRAKLAELRRSSEVAGRGGTIPYGPVLKPGMRDERVPLIRARFGLDIAAEASSDDLVYDTKVASAVADYQRAHHLPASGVLTSRTVASLSGGQPRRLEAEIVANMERWRWLPHDLGTRYVAVNIPDFSLDVFDHGRAIHHARVVVGKPDHQTPVFSETMKFIIVNPYWNVPLSIVKKEMLPKLAADPNYFANHGYETVERNGETYVRQPPGDSNALGRIKFMFPNRFSVYLHDTNAKSYFARDMRALSHGCVRVDQPFALAEAVLGKGWSAARVERMLGGDERTINLREPVAVHINYFTAFVDETGALRLRDDVYGYSARVEALLAADG